MSIWGPILRWPLDWEDAFSCFYRPLFSTPFRNNIASSIRLIMIFYHVLRYNTKEWSTVACYSNTNWLTSQKTTRDTTRSGVNIYSQNGIISCRLKKMLILHKPHFSTPLWNDTASSHRLKMTFYVLRHVPISQLTFNQFSWYLTNFA